MLQAPPDGSLKMAVSKTCGWTRVLRQLLPAESQHLRANRRAVGHQQWARTHPLGGPPQRQSSAQYEEDERRP